MSSTYTHTFNSARELADFKSQLKRLKKEKALSAADYDAVVFSHKSSELELIAQDLFPKERLSELLTATLPSRAIYDRVASKQAAIQTQRDGLLRNFQRRFLFVGDFSFFVQNFGGRGRVADLEKFLRVTFASLSHSSGRIVWANKDGPAKRGPVLVTSYVLSEVVKAMLLNVSSSSSSNADDDPRQQPPFTDIVLLGDEDLSPLVDFLILGTTTADNNKKKGSAAAASSFPVLPAVSPFFNSSSSSASAVWDFRGGPNVHLIPTPRGRHLDICGKVSSTNIHSSFHDMKFSSSETVDDGLPAVKTFDASSDLVRRGLSEQMLKMASMQKVPCPAASSNAAASDASNAGGAAVLVDGGYVRALFADKMSKISKRNDNADADDLEDGDDGDGTEAANPRVKHEQTRDRTLIQIVGAIRNEALTTAAAAASTKPSRTVWFDAGYGRDHWFPPMLAANRIELMQGQLQQHYVNRDLKQSGVDVALAIEIIRTGAWQYFVAQQQQQQQSTASKSASTESCLIFLVAGDGDLSPAVAFCRGLGCAVLVNANRGSCSKELREVASRFESLELC